MLYEQGEHSKASKLHGDTLVARQRVLGPVHPDTLEAHRSARRAAEVAGTGQPVTVRYKDIVFETMTTADVMEAIIRPVARDRHASFAEAKISRQATGSPTYFVSHAWDSLFVDLVDSLAAYLEGAAQDETFPWLDIFAINQDDSGGQFSAMDELDDGATLKQVIELSQATLVVLDKDRVAPLARLWCLYEIGSTPPSKLQLLTHGFSEKDISQHIWKINAGGALCFSDQDRQMIQASIIRKFGSLDQFTTELRLRLLLRDAALLRLHCGVGRVGRARSAAVAIPHGTTRGDFGVRNL